MLTEPEGHGRAAEPTVAETLDGGARQYDGDHYDQVRYGQGWYEQDDDEQDDDEQDDDEQDRDEPNRDEPDGEDEQDRAEPHREEPDGEPVGGGEASEAELLAPGRASPGHPGLGRRRRRRRRFRLALLVALVVALVAAVIGYARVSSDINPGGRPGPLVAVTLPRGASTLLIARLLARAGVIHGPDVFEAYLKLHGGGPLLAGTYRLRTNQGYTAVIAELENGPVLVTYKLVVPEGFTVRQIALAVGRLHMGITAPAFRAAATNGQVRSPYEPPASTDLEGLLFPATYPVPQGERADQLVKWMVKTFDIYAAQLGLTKGARQLGYSPYQVVKVASIVQREAGLEQDRGPIASAIYNRLARGMPIGAESTLLYVDPNGSVDITAPSPYNTLLNKGLPPTPISNPGVASLRAAISPPQTTYLYWVEINPDGKMGFATTGAQFKQLQHDCRVVHLC